jgi:hypothetical protein
MPIPKPNPNETHDDYIGRCMEAIGGEYENNLQAVAVCHSTFVKDKMSKIKDTPTKVMARVKYDTDFRGINLQEGLEGACWEGYEAIGTKILDGREVPNCVPIKED